MFRGPTNIINFSIDNTIAGMVDKQKQMPVNTEVLPLRVERSIKVWH